jgi:hypothetical protein
MLLYRVRALDTDVAAAAMAAADDGRQWHRVDARPIAVGASAVVTELIHSGAAALERRE